MTTLSLLGGDWLLSFDDENDGGNAVAGLRKLEYVSGVVRTSNEVYSAVADAADEFQAMGFRNPMLPVTPNAYTMENFYFIPRSSTEKLKEGAISANWSLTGTRAGDGVLRKEYVVGLGSNFVAGDIGKQVVQGLDTGTLLDYDIDPDGTLVAWIRPDDPSADTFAATGSMSVVADSGTGVPDTTSAAVSGFKQLSAVQAIGSVPTATEVYVLQNRIKLSDHATNTDQWWATDSTVSLGIISILVEVLDSGASNDPTVDGIAQGDVEVFARRYTSLYDHFRLNVASGGFQALPLASSPDINNTTGYRTTGTLSGVTGTFTVGNGIYAGASWVTATARGVITETNANSDLEYYLVGTEVGALPDFSNTQSIQEYDFATSADGDADATTGTIANNLGGPTDATSGEGGTVTITIGTTTFDFDGDATAEPWSITVDAQSNVPIAKVYERLKYVTRRGSDNTFWTTVATSVPGETYRGLESQVQYNTPSGTFTQGDDIDISAKPNYSARVFSVNTTDTYVMLTDQQTSIQVVATADVLRDEALDTVTVDSTPDTFTSPKQSPFGTFTGTQIFGARGVLFTNIDINPQAYILSDDNGVLRSPPNTVSFTVNNTLSGDRVLVARDTGTSGIIDKDQFGGLATPAVGYNQLGDNVIRMAGTIDSEVPAAAYVRVVETTLQEEHHYVYESRTAQALGEFTLKALTGGNTGTATAGSSTTQLVDDGRNFVSDGVEVGMMVRNTTALKTTHVWEVTGFATAGLTSNDTLLLRALYGTPDDFDTSDTYEINLLIQTYANTDDAFDLILDIEATTTSASNTFVQSTLFDVVVNVRQGKVILPFTQNTSVTSAGGSVTVVRQPDTIAT